jgi:hypothetical protein
MGLYHAKGPTDVRAFLAAVGLILRGDRKPSAQEIEERLKKMRKGQLFDAITRLKHNADVSTMLCLLAFSSSRSSLRRNTMPRKGR